MPGAWLASLAGGSGAQASSWIDDIGPGEDFARRIDAALAECQVALILIGPRWLTAEGPDGVARIDAPGDFVREEIAAALARPDVTVVPVLIEGMSMPAPTRLPDEITPLAKLNAFELSNRHWDYDVQQLGRFIARYGDRLQRWRHRAPRLLIRAVPLMVLAIAAVVAAILSGGGSGDETAAQRVAACEKTHGLRLSSETRQPQSGESHFKRSDVSVISPTTLIFQQTTYVSCTWPQGPGADPDGYLAMTVTTTNGPGQSDGSGRDFADVIESRCDRLALQYNEAHSGVQTPFAPFTAAPGDIWAPGTSTTTPRFAKVGQIGAPSEQGLNLPFYPHVSDVVVLHGQQELQTPTCLA
jgi:TIR domain